eukprot:TRINITY_DN21761_c0_g1_i1.p1 TRINITY_DN21761_c0_g1~~TRINITY_DN21761_c0_g1_i1.p1  ORF type:complete len:568 (-),score=99.11 TRINITY_DN21761_c0_g1_i1:424-2127(-)
MAHVTAFQGFIFVVSFLSVFPCVHADPSVVHTKAGDVKGRISDNTVVFSSIPFAEPPVGALRFRPPVPKKSWDGVLDVSGVRDWICPQTRSLGGVTLGFEDCLYLDVVTPIGALATTSNSSTVGDRAKGANVSSETLKPVMVWFFGGGYVLGDKWEFGLYDARNIVAADDYVHVAVNYRLSALGFLALPELRNETGTSGNYALQDQRLALQWVQANIHAFGGDPSRVTIYGESAGAISVCYHLGAPASKGLFQRAIMESGNCRDVFFLEWSHAVSFSEAYAEAVGCPGPAGAARLECLRELSAAGVLGGGVMEKVAARMGGLPGGGSFVPLLSPLMPWGAAMDGSPEGLTASPFDLIARGEGSRGVPLIIGTNHDEGDIFVLSIPFVTGVLLPFTRSSMVRALRHFLNESVAETAITMAPYATAPTWESAASWILRDVFFGCPAQMLAKLRARLQPGVPTYIYHFDYDKHSILPNFGDFHASELRYVYNNPWLGPSFSDADKKVARHFGDWWGSHAHGKSPTSAGAPQWPPYTHANPVMMRIVENPEVIDDAFPQCAFWERVNPIGR